MNNLQQELSEWAKSIGIFDANHLAKIREELLELEADPTDRKEMADILLALMLHASWCGVDLLSVGREKFEIVKGRKYGNPDARGVIRHIGQENEI